MRALRDALAPALALALTFAPSPSFAGGGPMNVVVLYSQDDASATEVAKLYEKERDLPPGHLCPLPGFTPAMTQIDVGTFLSMVQAPFDACLAALPQPDEIDYVVLVRGLPYRVDLPVYTASLEAMIQVGHGKNTATGEEVAGAGQPDAAASVPNPLFNQSLFWSDADSPVLNQYAAWYARAAEIAEKATQAPAFHRSDVKPKGTYDFSNQLFIVQSLDGFDYEDAKALITRAKAAEAAPPSGEILCMHAEDEARGARDPECEFATRMLKGAGFNAAFIDPFDGALAGREVMAYFTGSSDTVKNAIAGNTFAPGAIADNLTSYGAVIENFFCTPDGATCPAAEAQTSIARFIRAGATGAHGTVNEPYNNVAPNAGALLHYTFGYSMGESFLLNQRYLYWQNIHLGDPLTTPYAARPKVEITATTAALTVKASHAAGIARIDVYQSGKRVGQIAGAPELVIDKPGAAGEKLDLLAVAVAANAPVTRAGWPEPNQLPQPDVQGWTAASIVLQEPSGAGGGGGAGGGASSAAGGGGGASASSGSGGDAADDAAGCACRAGGERRGGGAGGAAALALCLAALTSARLRGRVARRS